jgi:hypothetical protein
MSLVDIKIVLPELSTKMAGRFRLPAFQREISKNHSQMLVKLQVVVYSNVSASKSFVI